MSEAMTARALEQRLLHYAKSSDPRFEPLLISSLPMLLEQLELRNQFYFQRNFWEYGVKAAVAIIGHVCLALGAAAVPVLLLSSLALVANWAINQLLASYDEPVLEMEPNGQMLAEQTRPMAYQPRFWLQGYEAHQVMLDSQQKQGLMIKSAIGIIASYGLVVASGMTFSLALGLSMSAYISTLLLEAEKITPHFCNT